MMATSPLWKTMSSSQCLTPGSTNVMTQHLATSLVAWQATTETAPLDSDDPNIALPGRAGGAAPAAVRLRERRAKAPWTNQVSGKVPDIER